MKCEVRKLLVELIDAAAQRVGLAERARYDEDSGAVLFGGIEVMEDEDDAAGLAVYRTRVVPSYDRDTPPDVDVNEVARTRSVYVVAAEVVKLVAEEVINSAIEDHSAYVAWRDAEDARCAWDG